MHQELLQKQQHGDLVEIYQKMSNAIQHRHHKKSKYRSFAGARVCFKITLALRMRIKITEVKVVKNFHDPQVVASYDQHIVKLIRGYTLIHVQIAAILQHYLPEKYVF